ncbi:hypothetical protein CN621_02300 [Bacillus wiedmannii]|uniref:hypothetical protein n=1 Tax=Bacillus wiedmannii TaxID=1890302 RepID=UPI000BF2227F|nr:hypothetical protein [Bacillus wiedmannii]PEN03407.1 hypothetical protein CN621_02300 [Bacillus wiedmannii]
MIKEISLFDLNEIIDNRKAAFLCGNGFSMNFDSDFGNIFNRLYDAHKEIIKGNAEYKIKANSLFENKCKGNYENVKMLLEDASSERIVKIFSDALIFAESIQQNNRLIDELWNRNLIKKLVFGLSEQDILNQICKIGQELGIERINIEHWTILIYFYFAIQQVKPSYYEFPENNLFLKAIDIGDENSNEAKDDITLRVITNGFSTYYRMLFSIVIFANGKSVDHKLLNKINEISISGINDFLQKFECLCSLNYDHILENITKRNVEHFHGEFIKDEKEYVFSQSYGLSYTDGYISFSDILIGDYFIFKSLLPIISNFAIKSNPYNKKTKPFSNRMNDVILTNAIDTFFIFGMNIENDQHVIRNIMVCLHSAGIRKPKIVYSYFNEKERNAFVEQFEAVITFGEELSSYAKNIEVNYIKTQDILNAYFYKNEIVEELLN